MKKLLLALILGLSVVGIAKVVYAACVGSYCYDDTGATITAPLQLQGGLRLPVYTSAQIQSLLGPTTGQALIECFNCTNSTIGLCRSTGPAAGSWVILASTGGAMPNSHCQ